MNSTIINDRNARRLNDRIAAEEGRATARTMTADDLLRAADVLEDRLIGIPKAVRVGATAVIGPGEAVPNNYRHAAQGTFATLERRATGWALVGVYRDTVPSRSGGAQVDEVVRITITARQCSRLTRSVVADRGITVAASRPEPLAALLAVASTEELLDAITEPAVDPDGYAAMAVVDPDGFLDWVAGGGPLPVALAALRRVASDVRDTVLAVARARTAVSV